MAQFVGLFDSFDNLDQINIENVAAWLKPPPNLIQLENYLANRILYPQTLPMNTQDMEIDLAILREALKLNLNQTKQNDFLTNSLFLNMGLRKILIPERFLKCVGDLKKLTWAFVDALPIDPKRRDWFEDLWAIVLTGDVDETVGSLIIPQLGGSSGEIQLNIMGKSYKVKTGSLLVIPCLNDSCELSYKLKQGKLLGKSENSVQVSGGSLGIMIDARKR